MTASQIAVVVLALALALLTSVALFAASTLLSFKGSRPLERDSSLGRRPFTGGVTLGPQRFRYYTELMALVSFFLLAEALAIFLLFSPAGLETALFALLGLGGILSSAVLFQRRRRAHGVGRPQ
ncbi:MAG: hypothetical protein QW405_00925 [Fervidicoccaceae archaeon]